eukprot:2397946-Prymnesium_polylepis.3
MQHEHAAADACRARADGESSACAHRTLPWGLRGHHTVLVLAARRGGAGWSRGAPAHALHDQRPDREASREAQQPSSQDALHIVQCRRDGAHKRAVAERVGGSGAGGESYPQQAVACRACAGVAAHETGEEKGPDKVERMRLVVACHRRGRWRLALLARQPNGRCGCAAAHKSALIFYARCPAADERL